MTDARVRPPSLPPTACCHRVIKGSLGDSVVDAAAVVLPVQFTKHYANSAIGFLWERVRTFAVTSP